MATKASAANIRAELLEATKVKPKRNEAEAALAARVAEVVDGEDFEYESLSKGAQAWFEAVADANEHKKEIPALPGGEEEPEEEAEGGTRMRRAAKKTAAESSNGRGRAAKRPVNATRKADAEEKKKPRRAAKEEEESEPRVSGADMIRVIMCSAPKVNWTPERVKEKLDEKGVQVEDKRVYRIFAQTRRCLEILAEKGKLA